MALTFIPSLHYYLWIIILFLVTILPLFGEIVTVLKVGDSGRVGVAQRRVGRIQTYPTAGLANTTCEWERDEIPTTLRELHVTFMFFIDTIVLQYPQSVCSLSLCRAPLILPKSF